MRLYGQNKSRHSQQGVAVLFVVVMMSIIMGLLALAASRTVVVEQRMTGNDIRAREAHEAAEAGLAFAKAWADSNVVKNDMSCPGSSGCPTLPDVTGTTSGEVYLLTISFDVDANGNVGIQSVATNSDNGSAIVEDWVSQVSIFNEPFFPPPLVANGNVVNFKGGPVIDAGSSSAVAIVANTGSTINPGSHLNLTGTTKHDTFPSTSTPAWDYVFSLSLQAALNKAISDGYVESSGGFPSIPENGKGPFYHYDDDKNFHQDVGSADNPVVLIITGNKSNGKCPKINGGPVIYGVVYFADGCTDNGWGGTTIYGSVVAEGYIDKMNSASSSINGVNGSSATSGMTFLDYATSIPGTWKDF